MLNLGMYKSQRVAILIDVQNMYYSGKNLYNSKLNYEEVIKEAVSGRTLIRAVGYTIRADVKDEGVFHSALENMGIEVKTKDLLVFHGGHKKGDWDVGLAIDAIRMAEKVDTIIVISGDGDFKEMYEYVRGKGARVEVVAFGKTASSSIRDYVDRFVDLDKDQKRFLAPLKPVRNGNKNKGPVVGSDGKISNSPVNNEAAIDESAEALVIRSQDNKSQMKYNKHQSNVIKSSRNNNRNNNRSNNKYNRNDNRNNNRSNNRFNNRNPRYNNRNEGRDTAFERVEVKPKEIIDDDTMPTYSNMDDSINDLDISDKVEIESKPSNEKKTTKKTTKKLSKKDTSKKDTKKSKSSNEKKITKKTTKKLPKKDTSKKDTKKETEKKAKKPKKGILEKLIGK